MSHGRFLFSLCSEGFSDAMKNVPAGVAVEGFCLSIIASALPPLGEKERGGEGLGHQRQEGNHFTFLSLIIQKTPDHRKSTECSKFLFLGVIEFTKPKKIK